MRESYIRGVGIKIGISKRRIGKKSSASRERKTFRPQELPWPENIITEMHVSDVLEKDEYIPLNDDQME